MSIDALQAKNPLEIHWVQFPLAPGNPPEGRALTDLFPGRDLTPMKDRMRGLMQEAGLPYGDRSHTYNSRRAQELGKWADSLEESSLGEAYHKAMFHAYFVDGVNIYETDVLLGIVERAGLDRDAAQEVLDSGSFAAAVDADWHQSRQRRGHWRAEFCVAGVDRGGLSATRRAGTVCPASTAITRQRARCSLVRQVRWVQPDAGSAFGLLTIPFT